MPSPDVSTYYRKGFGLKAAVQGTLDADYSGRLVDLLRSSDYTLAAGDLTVRLAREFGFCYGVERAVEYAYQARSKFPNRRIFLVGEIIHNPHVNAKLRAMGVEILLPRPDGLAAAGSSFDYGTIRPDDVVILPAFGVTIADFETLRGIGCVVVDTTCGSVLNVWKRVEVYARDGFTALIHGKHYHEETRATASQVEKYPGGQYLVVRDMGEARVVCDYIEGHGEREEFQRRFAHAASPGFDPDRGLRKVGVANQTTMLARESLAIADEVGTAMARAYGETYRAESFRSFDTICSATQERQDAVEELLREPLDVMLVVGGYNSSNTISLAALCAERVTTYHLADASCIDVERGALMHKPLGERDEVETAGWLAAPGPLRVGITAGASTPNNKIGDAVARIFATRGIDVAGLAEPPAGDEYSLAVLERLTAGELDAFPLGVIRIDESAIVTAFNRAEEQRSGCRPEDVIGRHFFEAVAPCANDPAFRGRVEACLRGGAGCSDSFRYVYAATGASPRPVQITVHGARGGAWIVAT